MVLSPQDYKKALEPQVKLIVETIDNGISEGILYTSLPGLEIRSGSFKEARRLYRSVGWGDLTWMIVGSDIHFDLKLKGEENV